MTTTNSAAVALPRTRSSAYADRPRVERHRIAALLSAVLRLGACGDTATSDGRTATVDRTCAASDVEASLAAIPIEARTLDDGSFLETVIARWRPPCIRWRALDGQTQLRLR